MKNEYKIFFFLFFLFSFFLEQKINAKIDYKEKLNKLIQKINFKENKKIIYGLSVLTLFGAGYFARKYFKKQNKQQYKKLENKKDQIIPQVDEQNKLEEQNKLNEYKKQYGFQNFSNNYNLLLNNSLIKENINFNNQFKIIIEKIEKLKKDFKETPENEKQFFVARKSNFIDEIEAQKEKIELNKNFTFFEKKILNNFVDKIFNDLIDEFKIKK